MIERGSQELHAALVECDLPMEAVARHIGVSRATVFRWRNNQIPRPKSETTTRQDSEDDTPTTIFRSTYQVRAYLDCWDKCKRGLHPDLLAIEEALLRVDEAVAELRIKLLTTLTENG